MSGDKSVLTTTSKSERERVTAAIWGDLEDFIITGTDQGELNMIDVRKKETVKTIKPHKGIITDLQTHVDGTMFISASKDHSAKVGLGYSCLYFCLCPLYKPYSTFVVAVWHLRPGLYPHLHRRTSCEFSINFT